MVKLNAAFYFELHFEYVLCGTVIAEYTMTAMQIKQSAFSIIWRCAAKPVFGMGRARFVLPANGFLDRA
jgi:hypothetical protein